MVEIKTDSRIDTSSDAKHNTGIAALQDIISLEYAETISYDEAWELGESLLEFFEAFSGEGVGDDNTATRTCS